MNYFEFYNIPISLSPDQAEIKRLFYEYSKAYHPDFHSEESDLTEEEAIQKSAYNNTAYKTLKDFNSRLKYFLELKEVIKPEDKDEIPQDFLMEMMDINERIMELQFDNNPIELDKLDTEVSEFENQLKQSVADLLEKDNLDPQELKTVKNFYYKQKYLRRIKENLEKIED